MSGVNQSKGDSEKTLQIGCGLCNRSTHHKVLAEADWHYDIDEAGIWESRDYMVVECQGCKTMSFCIASRNSEDIDYDPITGEPCRSTTYTYYPSRIVGKSELESALELPVGVYRIYKETHGALSNQLPILAGIGMRAIVEAVCNERQIAGRNLDERIDALASNGIVTRDGANILHSIRLMGNKAAHEVQPNSIDELTTGFSVIEYLLQGVYIMPKLAKKLPQKT